MMKNKFLILLVAILGSGNLKAQTPLKFDTKFYNAVEEWVVFPKLDRDSAYAFGFIYLDLAAGPTFHFEGRLKVEGETLTKIETPELKKSLMKYRLAANTNPTHVLSADQLAQLSVEKVPKWLVYYKNGDDKYYQIALGNMFNANGKAELAKPILEKVYQQEKKNEKLIFELSYAYNALGEYNHSMPVLKAAIKDYPENALFYKELVYAYVKLKDLKSAEDVYERFVTNAKNKDYQFEMAHNMMYENFVKRDKTSFDKWAAIVEKSSNPTFVKNVQAMRVGWDQK